MNIVHVLFCSKCYCLDGSRLFQWMVLLMARREYLSGCFWLFCPKICGIYKWYFIPTTRHNATHRWWGQLNSSYCNWICLNSLHAETVGIQKHHHARSCLVASQRAIWWNLRCLVFKKYDCIVYILNIFGDMSIINSRKHTFVLELFIVDTLCRLNYL